MTSEDRTTYLLIDGENLDALWGAFHEVITYSGPAAGTFGSIGSEAYTRSHIVN